MLGFLLRKRSVGARGEAVAARFLRTSGFRVIGRNVHVGIGEADIVCIAPDKRTLVIVEVKTRVFARADGPRPEDNVGAHKQRKLRQVAQAIARKRGLGDRPIRIDVVGVEFAEGQKPIVRHHPGAVKG